MSFRSQGLCSLILGLRKRLPARSTGYCQRSEVVCVALPDCVRSDLCALLGDRSTSLHSAELSDSQGRLIEKIHLDEMNFYALQGAGFS